MRNLRTAAWFFSASVVLAAEPTPAPPPSSPPEDSITAAKRDLELIKASRTSLEQKKAGLPQFSTPEFQVEAPSALPRSVPKTPAEAAALKKSENWLVDAMMKRPGRAADAKGRAPEAAATATADGSSRTEADEVSDTSPRGQRNSERPETRERPETIVNPLTNFMAGWMTPQDFKLLQPTWGRDADGASGSRDEFAAAPPPTATGNRTERLGLGKSPGDAASRMPRENPFLASLGPSGPASGSQSPAAVAQPPPVKTQGSSATPPPPSASTPAPVDPTRPPFMKPQDDAKYFKPLKRF